MSRQQAGQVAPTTAPEQVSPHVVDPDDNDRFWYMAHDGVHQSTKMHLFDARPKGDKDQGLLISRDERVASRLMESIGYLGRSSIEAARPRRALLHRTVVLGGLQGHDTYRHTLEELSMMNYRFTTTHPDSGLVLAVKTLSDKIVERRQADFESQLPRLNGCLEEETLQIWTPLNTPFTRDRFLPAAPLKRFELAEAQREDKYEGTVVEPSLFMVVSAKDGVEMTVPVPPICGSLYVDYRKAMAEEA